MTRLTNTKDFFCTKFWILKLNKVSTVEIWKFEDTLNYNLSKIVSKVGNHVWIFKILWKSINEKRKLNEDNKTFDSRQSVKKNAKFRSFKRLIF